MSKSICISITLSLLALSLAGCASSGDSKKNKGTTMFHLVKDGNYAKATERLNSLYAAYPSSAEAEDRFRSEMDSAAAYLPKKHKARLDRFLNINRNGVAEKFFSGLYFHHAGIDARGQKSVNNTERKKLGLLRDNLVNSIARFQSVLKDDPNSYLAHMYNGINFSYMGTIEAELAEFRAAVDINPTSVRVVRVWNSFLTHSQPRWGGSYDIMQDLIDELATHEQKNPKLRSLKGLALSDKADAFIRQEDFVSAEDHIFRALEFGSNDSYGQTVDYLMRKVKQSGDEEGACRIIKKTHAIYPKHERYRELAAGCS